MTVYRCALVWLLRAGGVACLVLTVVHIATTLQIYNSFTRGEPGMTYLLDMLVPLGATLVVASLVALTLAEILALQIKRATSA